VRADDVAVANGFVPLLDAALRALGVRRCLLPLPAFGEYRVALERAGVAVSVLALAQRLQFRYQADELLGALEAGGQDAILLANPQNPSGVLWDRAAVVSFVEEAARRGIRVLLDEAFIDYAPGQSVADEASRLGNLTVFRSVTKFHGMPGLRVAYVVAEDAARIRRELPPWAITTLAAIGVRAALADREYVARTLRVNAERREWLAARLRALWVESYPAAANFLLLRLAGVVVAERCWERMIVEHGIVLRSCANFEGLGRDHLRCAVRGDEENARLVEALGRVFRTETAQSDAFRPIGG
jgi:threonine-phosphate decarboxylase